MELTERGFLVVPSLRSWHSLRFVLCIFTAENAESTARRSRNQTECARPRAQKRRTATGEEAILSLKPCRSCCGRGRPMPLGFGPAFFALSLHRRAGLC